MPTQTLERDAYVLPRSQVASADAPVLHPGHYHAALVRSVLGTSRISGGPLLVRAAAESLSGWMWSDGLAEVASFFATAGLGRLDLSGLTAAGGTVHVHDSLFGQKVADGRNAASCGITAGLLAAAAGAVFGGGFDVEETRCAAVAGGDSCAFELRLQAGCRGEPEAVGGHAYDHQGKAGPSQQIGSRALPIREDTPGVLSLLGRRVARLPAGLHATLSWRLEREIRDVAGAKYAGLPPLMLTEAAQWAVYRTACDLAPQPALNAQEADPAGPAALIRRVAASAAALGWGEWEIRQLIEGERLVLRIHHGYEATSHRKLFGDSADARCYFARGTAAGLMNLLYLCGDLPMSGGASAYNTAFRSPTSFRAVETFCHARGDAYCEITASRLSSYF